jgi:hypothetical protein
MKADRSATRAYATRRFKDLDDSIRIEKVDVP